MKDLHLKPVQKAALSLIQSDLRFLYTVIKRINPNESNYIPSLLPYMGIVIDGAEEWVKAINNSSKVKLEIPLFSESEQVFYENNEKELFLREASMLLYGDSKYLEENVLHSVCRALREYLERPCQEDELEDEILEDYHIVREKQKLCLKGDITVRIAGKELDLGAFAAGVEFFADELSQLEWIHVHTLYFMTVENRTSWLRLRIPDTALFYLGGYSDRSQRDCLKKVFHDNPELTFWHFGDIDAGGLYIHEHLCRVTGIPFRLYRMSRKELEAPRFQSCLLPLTKQDRIRLKSLEKEETYWELVMYMLEQNVKLEQEIVSFYEMENGNMEEYFRC